MCSLRILAQKSFRRKKAFRSSALGKGLGEGNGITSLGIVHQASTQASLLHTQEWDFFVSPPAPKLAKQIVDTVVMFVWPVTLGITEHNVTSQQCQALPPECVVAVTPHFAFHF